MRSISHHWCGLVSQCNWQDPWYADWEQLALTWFWAMMVMSTCLSSCVWSCVCGWVSHHHPAQESQESLSPSVTHALMDTHRQTIHRKLCQIHLAKLVECDSWSHSEPMCIEKDVLPSVKLFAFVALCGLQQNQGTEQQHYSTSILTSVMEPEKRHVTVGRIDWAWWSLT